MDRCTGCYDLTEILLKTAWNAIQTINSKRQILDFQMQMTILSLMKMAESSPKEYKHWGKEKSVLFPQCFQKTCTADMLKQGKDYFTHWLIQSEFTSTDRKVLDFMNVHVFANSFFHAAMLRFTNEKVKNMQVLHQKINKRAMMALYRSTGWYVKSIHTKHYITWELV